MATLDRPHRTRKFTFDMADVKALIKSASDSVGRMDGAAADLDFDQGRGPRHNDPNAAVISRELLYATELLRTAAQELMMQYHQLKGWDDPRFD